MCDVKSGERADVEKGQEQEEQNIAERKRQIRLGEGFTIFRSNRYGSTDAESCFFFPLLLLEFGKSWQYVIYLLPKLVLLKSFRRRPIFHRVWPSRLRAAFY